MSYSCSVLKQLLKVVDFRTRHSTLSVLQSASVPLVVILPLYSCLNIPSYSQILQLLVHSITVSRYQFIQLLSSLPPSLIGWVFFFLSPLLKRENPFLLVGAVNFVHRCMLVPFFHPGIHIICISKAVHAVLSLTCHLHFFSVLPKIRLNCKIHQ